MNPRWWFTIGGFNALLAVSNLVSWLAENEPLPLITLLVNLTGVAISVVGYRLNLNHREGDRHDDRAR